MEYLFVYGTLLNEGSNKIADFLHKNSNFQGNGYFHGKVFNLGEYPGAILSENPDDRVYGKVFRLNDPAGIFSILDDYEGAAEISLPHNEFIRQRIAVWMESGEVKECWVYLYNHTKP
ncbi:MAG: gamma-glutamylcyclotransferase [Bacteroidales bacterium]|nr:gamma-glutamylcyclotransferase [Bacteroidales bacterium]